MKNIIQMKKSIRKDQLLDVERQKLLKGGAKADPPPWGNFTGG